MVPGLFPHCSVVSLPRGQGAQGNHYCEHCSVPLMVLDVEGNALEVNEAFKLMWDINPERLLSNQGYCIHRDPLFQDSELCNRFQEVLTGKTIQAEIQNYRFPSEFSIPQRKQFRKRKLFISVIPCCHEGRVKSVMMIYHQLSPIQDVKKLRLDCSQLASIANSVNDLKHDLNNPLLLIIGNAQLILSKSQCLPQDVVDKLGKILNAADRIKGLMEQYHSVTSLLDNNREVEELIAVD
jgi:nitrogen-specific signal transduction histidine kinase